MHIPVLLDEALGALNIDFEHLYIDCTFGGGGHTREIVKRGGRVLALDADPDAMKRLDESFGDRVTLVNTNFENVSEVAREQQFFPVSGVLFDLGLSSFHLADAERGFAFMLDGPLDMRFNYNSASHTAGQLIDALPEEGLVALFLKYGDEPNAEKIARVIKRKGTWAGRTTKELAEVIETSIGRTGKIHPATRVFQALRMAVNDETGVLERGLAGALDVLDVGGRIVVISFHSIEDRIVKNSFQEWSERGDGKMIGEVVVPTDEEVARNPRSRSAKMRVFESKK